MNTEFLLNYTPKSSLFTFKEEIDLVVKELNLICKSKEELQEIRNKVVEFYHPYINEYKYMQSMMSVTAVIDYLIYS